jgi:hypothetical protein
MIRASPYSVRVNKFNEHFVRPGMMFRMLQSNY